MTQSYCAEMKNDSCCIKLKYNACLNIAGTLLIFAVIIFVVFFIKRARSRKANSPHFRSNEHAKNNKQRPLFQSFFFGAFNTIFSVQNQKTNSNEEQSKPTIMNNVETVNCISQENNFTKLDPTNLPNDSLKVIVINNYVAQSSNELNLVIGDQIWLCGELHNEWGIGFNPVTGLQGTFPLNCCEEFIKLTTPPIFNQNVTDPLQNGGICIDPLSMLSTSSISETELSYSESISTPHVNSMYSSRLDI
jgi:hypothetical protein